VQHHNPENHNPNFHHCKIFKSHTEFIASRVFVNTSQQRELHTALSNPTLPAFTIRNAVAAEDACVCAGGQEHDVDA
jgi:hypothetical protein